MEELQKEQTWPEKALEETEKRYQALLETDIYGIQEIDTYGIITYMNPVQYKLLGYPPAEDIKGSQIWDILASDEDRDKLTNYLTRVAEGEESSFPWTGTYIRNDGSRIELEVDWKVRRDNRSRVTGFVSVISDILKHELSEEQKRLMVEEHKKLLAEERRKLLAEEQKKLVAEKERTERKRAEREHAEKERIERERVERERIERERIERERIERERIERERIERERIEREHAEREGEAVTVLLKIDEMQQTVNNLHYALEGGFSTLPDKESVFDKFDKLLEESRNREENDDESLLQLSPVDGITDDIVEEMKTIKEGMNILNREFQDKLKHDTHKNRIIDKLHDDLQNYKDDFLKKYLRAIIMDTIQVIDNIRKLVSHYNTKSNKKIDPAKLLNLLESVPSDLEDLFYKHGVKPFTCEGAVFDPARQRVLKTLPVNDKSKDRTVAESLRPGYEWDGDVIRPEIIAAHIYKPDSVNTKGE
ncbi:nucleotide exchange factor GrpE [Desulfobacterales bacterium HSG16]|nr:nucleotide exchange factor GrpE [Desulfobacterales bacterium HSG16]